MKGFKLVTSLVLFLLATISAVAQDTFRPSVHYLDSRVPLTKREVDEEAVKGFSASADVKLFKFGKLRGSAAYEFERRYNVEVYPFYFDGMNVVDLYRNVNTHYVGAQLGYAIGYRVEPFIGYFVGTNKIHEDADRQVVSKTRIGANFTFTEKSPLFAKVAIDFNKSYGSPNKMPLPLPAGGFVSPNSRQVVLGLGFRF
jgi:hypothetical protein